MNTSRDPISSLVEAVYGTNQLLEIKNKIQVLIDKYQPLITPLSNQTLSEKDVVLITYADQIRKTNEAPIKTIHNFLKNHVDGLLNTVHLLPFYPFSSDDGFAVVDFRQVKKDYGNWQEIESLSQDFHLMADAVVNHISSESQWLKGYLNGEEKFKDYFIESDPSLDYSSVTRPRALPLLHKYQGQNGPKWLWTTFSADQVDLNYANPNVLIEMLDILMFYCQKGAHLIRLDAVGYMWKELGTPCIHHKKTHLLIKLMRKVLDQVAPHTFLISETNVPHEENISYFGDNGDEAQLVYQFSFPPLVAHTLLHQNATKLTQWADTLPDLESNKMAFFNFCASHDGIGMRPATGLLDSSEIDFLVEKTQRHGGIASMRSNGDGSESLYELNINFYDLLKNDNDSEDLAIKKFMLSQTIMLSLPGVPGIYFHSLFGSQSWKDGVKESGIPRRINRQKLDYQDLVTALKDPGSLRYQIFEAYKKVLNIRTQQQAFCPAAKFEILHLGPQFFALKRKSKDQEVTAIHNVTNQRVNLVLPSQGVYFDHLSQESVNRDKKITFEAYQGRWLENEK